MTIARYHRTGKLMVMQGDLDVGILSWFPDTRIPPLDLPSNGQTRQMIIIPQCGTYKIRRMKEQYEESIGITDAFYDQKICHWQQRKQRQSLAESFCFFKAK